VRVVRCDVHYFSGGYEAQDLTVKLAQTAFALFSSLSYLFIFILLINFVEWRYPSKQSLLIVSQNWFVVHFTVVVYKWLYIT